MGNLLHIKSEFEREFPVGTLFPTQRQLIDAMREKASQFGFFVIDRGFSVLCFETTARDVENTRRQKAREELSRENGRIFTLVNFESHSKILRESLVRSLLR